jgi:Zn-dependent membrane protease YugP
MFGIIILFVIAGFIVQQRLKSKFKKYSKESLSNGMSGAEIAQKMLDDHGIYDVRIESVAGKLTDHYNPANKSVNLSPEVYSGRSVAAAAVAAHEVGHAVQHAQSYKWLEMRSQLVPMVQFSGKIMNIVIWSMILGVGFLGIFGYNTAIWILIAAQIAITGFAVITLPVEYDASNRALAWLTTSGLVTTEEHDKANDALSWAARTYLVAALASMAQLAYYFSLLRD